MSSTASTAHFPMAMLASAIGASTRAVAALHLSTGVLDAAPAPRARPEGLEGAQELLRGEVWPQRVRDVEVPGAGHLVDSLRRETIGEDPAGCVHDLRPAPVVERDVDVEPLIARGEILGLLHSFEHRGWQVLPSAQETEPGPALVQLRNLLTGRVQEELHEGLYLPLRASPVLARESIEG